jgi:hypothetical protein
MEWAAAACLLGCLHVPHRIVTPEYPQAKAARSVMSTLNLNNELFQSFDDSLPGSDGMVTGDDV